MIPSESPTFTSHNRGRNASENDGFLYQCRVSPKISARVGGNRNGGPNSFHRERLCFAVFTRQRVSSRWHNQRGVLVLITRTLEGSKASTNPTRRISARTRIFG